MLAKKRESQWFCEYHKDISRTAEDYIQLKDIENLIQQGHLKSLSREMVRNNPIFW